MHFAPSSSRALLAATLLALAAATAQGAEPAPGPASAAPLRTAPTDDALLAVAKMRPGAVQASSRATLSGGGIALLVALGGRNDTATFVLLLFEPDGRGGYAFSGRDEVKSEKAPGEAAISLSSGEKPFAPDGLVATVGWRAADGSGETQTLLYRRGTGHLVPLLALEPDRRFAPGDPRPSVRHDLEVLPTTTAGFRDLRVVTRQCSADGACGAADSVTSLTFDGVSYAERPYAIPYLDRVEASSVLRSAGALEDHSARAAVDGRPETAWCEGAKGPGWFQKLTFSFSPAQRVKALLVLPWSGGAEAADRTRPKAIRVVQPDGRKLDAVLPDAPGVQRVELPDWDRVFGLTVIITDVHKGTREDACIAELDFELAP